MTLKRTILGIIAPCYNEQEALEITAARLTELTRDLIKKKKISASSFILFVDDGSTDDTWRIITRLHRKSRIIKGLKLSRNFGQQPALLAGLMRVKDRADCSITLDADLQDDVNILEHMIDEYSSGRSIVYGVRDNRAGDTFFKRNSALLFYRLMNALGVRTVYNHSDFRLADRKALAELAKFGETNLFLRGIFPLIGLPSSIVYYERKTRVAGDTKYPLRKMITLAWGSITSFSSFPLRLVLYSGFVVMALSMMLGVWVLTAYFRGAVVPGWTSTMLPIFFFGGIQMCSIGILGEYIAKLFNEVKSRPRYIVEKELL